MDEALAQTHPDGKRDALQVNAEIREWVFSSNAPLVGKIVNRIRDAFNVISAKWIIRAIIQQQSAFNRALLSRLFLFEEHTQERLGTIEYMSLQNDRDVVALQRRVAELSSMVSRLEWQLGTVIKDTPAIKPEKAQDETDSSLEELNGNANDRQ